MREFFRKVLAGRWQGPQRSSVQTEVNRAKSSANETNYSKYVIRARKLEQLGKPLDAMRLLERAAKFHEGDLDVTRQLAFLYSENGFQDEARDAYWSILQCDITDLDAIDNFLGLNYVSPAPSGTVTEIITKLAESLPSSEEFDAEAAVFVLPSMRLMAPADEAIRRLKYSESATARYISALATAKREITDEVGESAPELQEAKIVISLVRGDDETAQKLMHDTPGLAGLRALKHAIQRELRASRTGEASELLAKYMLFKPNSGWARKEHDHLTRGRKVRSRHQLTVGGFPFPDLPVEQGYTPNPKKILYLLHNSLPHASAGYATRTHGLLSALRARGWRVEGVTRLGYPSRPDTIDRSGVPPAKSKVIDGNKYHRLLDDEAPLAAEPLEEYIRRYSNALYELALEEKPALIHAASNHWNGLAAVIVGRRLGIPSIYEVRGLWEITEASRNPKWGNSGAFRFMKRMETDAAHAATRVLTITKALKNELIERGVPASKITVVPNAVDPSRFRPSDDSSGVRAALGLQDKTVIGYVGSLVDYEGLPLLIESASQLARERDDFKLVIVGNGPEFLALNDAVNSRGLSDRVVFVGEVPHDSISSYYDVIDVIALPRLALPVCEMVSPLKPFEAMASGKALVASDVAALSEIIEHGKTGLLHEKGSVDSLTESLELLLDNPGLRRGLGDKASQWVRENRSWNRVSGDVTKVYEHLLTAPRSDQQVLHDILKLESTYVWGSRGLLDAVFELGSRNLNTYLGQRLLVHSALNRRSSRYSLRVVELFAGYGQWNLVSYLARHALPSVKSANFARTLRAVLSKEHNLLNITSARVSVHELTGRSQLVDALAELLTGTQIQSGQSVLSPRFLILKSRSNTDASLLDLASRLCEILGVQLVVQRAHPEDSEPRYSSSGIFPDNSRRYTAVLNVIANENGDYAFQKNSSGVSSVFWSLGTLTQKEVLEIAAIHWLLSMQASAVLKLQRTKWRSRLIESLAPILPLSTVPDAFAVATVALKRDPEAERYLQRAASAFLGTGHYRGAREILSQISLDRQDARYANRAAEAAFGTADFQKVLGLKDRIEKSPRMNKVLTESEAACRMLARLEGAAQSKAPIQPPHKSEKALRVVSILHASVPDQIGGYANRAHALLRSLIDHDIQVSAFTRPGFPDYSLEQGQIEEHSYEGVTYHRVGSNLRRESSEYAYMEESIDAYRSVLEAEKPDVVHLRSTYVSALPGLIAAKELSIPTLYEVSGMWELVYASYRDARREGLRARTVAMENEVLKHADRVVTLTEAMASEIHSRVAPRRQVTLVPNAVDLERFKPQPKRVDLKTSLGWQTDIPVIGYAGSLVDYEGLDVLLRATEILKRKGLEFRVLIIGDGAVKLDLEHLSNQLGLTDTVRFTGRLPHHMVGEYYTIFDVCAFPRYLTHATRAVSPLKPFEALAAAKPIVVSDIPALSEIVGKDSAAPRGLVVQENNPQALSEALERLLTDSKVRNSLSASGLKWVRAERSWETVSRLFAEAVADTSVSAAALSNPE